MSKFSELFQNPAIRENQVKYLNALGAARDPDHAGKTAAAARFSAIGDVLVNSLFPTDVSLTVNQLQNEVRNALIRDSRFRTQQPDGMAGTNCWVTDIVMPSDGSNEWTAVISKDGLLFKIGFTINDASQAVLSVLPPVETRAIYNSILNSDPRDANKPTRDAAEGDESTETVNDETREAADINNDSDNDDDDGNANQPTRDAADKDGITGQSEHDDSGEEKKKGKSEVAFDEGCVGETTPNTNSTSK